MHDLNLTLRFADKFIMLKDGQIYSKGDSNVVTPKNIRDVYNVNAYVDHYKGIPIVVLV